MHELLAALGIEVARSPLNLSFVLALVCCVLVWLFVWQTRYGYALRVVGQNETAAVYGGISPARQIMLAMTLSGALAGFVALNMVMGAQHRLTLDFTGGFGFVGIAVALMGRNHPVGIMLAALLFGALYQGGSELSFDMPALSRDLVVVIQGLVILFAGALEHMFRPSLEALFAKPAPAEAVALTMDEVFLQALLLSDSTIRLATPLVLAALAGLFCERSGVVDIALEGKMLGAAFAAAATAAVTGSAWLGLAGGMRVRDRPRHGPRLCLHHPSRQPGGLGHGAQHHGRRASGRRWPRPGSARAGARRCSARARASRRSCCRSPSALRGVPVLGPIYAELISGHNILVYATAPIVPLVAWVVYRTRFGLRLRAVGENPSAVDTAGISVTGDALPGAGRDRPALRHRRRLSRDRRTTRRSSAT